MDSEYYQKHKEEIRAKQKAYYYKNIEKFKERNKRWRKENKDRVDEYRIENKDKRNQQGKEWRSKNKKALAKKQREYRENNPDIIKKIESKRIRPGGHREKFNEYHKQWSRENQDKIQQYYHKRRARLKSGEGTLTGKEIKEQRRKQDGVCYYCKNILDNNGLGHIDHKTPLSRGGLNIAGNIVIACSTCNLIKGTKTEEEFNHGIDSH